jgi:hypothetical protein
MKKILTTVTEKIARTLMKSDFLWEAVRRLPNHDFFDRQRYGVVQKRARRSCAEFLDQRQVLGGPFAGMKYAHEAAVGSSLWPKLLGTYESELRSCFERIASHRDYRLIVDVGYAEGFYLIGLGRLFDDAELVGFDTEAEAIRLCRANAHINQVDEKRLTLHGAFDPETFRSAVDDRALVIVDCEGFENDVVESLSSDLLERADWLIETHDHLVEGTTERVKSALDKTHELTVVATDDDLELKCQLLPESIRQTCDPYVQEALVSEGRQAKQRWVFATRRAA